MPTYEELVNGVRRDNAARIEAITSEARKQAGALPFASLPYRVADRIADKARQRIDGDQYGWLAEDAIRLGGLERSGGKTTSWDADRGEIVVEWSGDVTDLETDYLSTDLAALLADVRRLAGSADIPPRDVEFRLEGSGGRSERQEVSIRCPFTGPRTAYAAAVGVTLEDYEDDEDPDDDIDRDLEDYADWQEYDDGDPDDSVLTILDGIDTANDGVRSALGRLACAVADEVSRVWRAECDYLGSDKWVAERWDDYGEGDELTEEDLDELVEAGLIAGPGEIVTPRYDDDDDDDDDDDSLPMLTAAEFRGA